MKTEMKKMMLAAVALMVAAAVLIPAASAAVSYSIEFEGGDFDVTEKTYTAYVVLNGANGQYVGTQTLTLTTNDDITISDIALGEDIEGKFLSNGNKFTIYDGGKVSEDNAKVAQFTVKLGTLAQPAPELNITVSEVWAGASKAAQSKITDDVTVTAKVLDAAAAHTLVVDGGAITVNVEDKKVIGDLTSTVKVYSEQGEVLGDLTGINFKIAQAEGADKLVEIAETSDYFDALYALNAGTDAKATIAIYDSADNLLDEKTFTLTVEQKADLASVSPITDVFAIPADSTFPYTGESVREAVFAKIEQKKHNTDYNDGFERIYGEDFDADCLEFAGDALTGTEPISGGVYTFKINLPASDNYAAGVFEDESYKFIVTGEIAPSFVMNNDKTVTGHFNAENKANITMRYYSTDAENFNKFDKLDYVVPKFVTNTEVTDGASMQLALKTAPSGYTEGSDYSYNKDTQPEFKFLSAKKTMQAQEEVFVFESEYCLGDVNKDGNVSASDASLICSKILAEKPDWSAEEIFYGKTAGGVYTPTVLDAVLIAKYAVGLADADFNEITA